MKVGFVHTRQLHTHRTGNCICKLAFGLCNKLLSITPSFFSLGSRGGGGDDDGNELLCSINAHEVTNASRGEDS